MFERLSSVSDPETDKKLEDFLDTLPLSDLRALAKFGLVTCCHTYFRAFKLLRDSLMRGGAIK